jgi:hypothetical protein
LALACMAKMLREDTKALVRQVLERSWSAQPAACYYAKIAMKHVVTARDRKPIIWTPPSWGRASLTNLKESKCVT